MCGGIGGGGSGCSVSCLSLNRYDGDWMALERREDWQTDTEREGGRKGTGELNEWRGSGNIPLAMERCGVVLIAFVSDIGPFCLTH